MTEGLKIIASIEPVCKSALTTAGGVSIGSIGDVVSDWIVIPPTACQRSDLANHWQQLTNVSAFDVP